MGLQTSLQTKRLSLRWLTLEDAPLMLAIWNDPDFIRNVGDRGVRTIEQTRDEMTEGALQLYRKHGYGPYRVSLRDEDVAIGVCGLFKRESLDDPDIGFGFLPEYCGQGFGWESASAVLEFARDTLRFSRLTAIVSPGNVASIALIKKLGMNFESSLRMPDEDHDVSLYGISWQVR